MQPSIWAWVTSIEPLGTLLRRHGADDAHGGCYGTLAAVEQGAVPWVSSSAAEAGGSSRTRTPAAPPASRAAVEIRAVGWVRKRCERRGAHADDRDRMAEHLGRDQRAQGDDVLRLAKHQRCRRAPGQRQVEQDPEPVQEPRVDGIARMVPVTHWPQSG